MSYILELRSLRTFLGVKRFALHVVFFVAWPPWAVGADRHGCCERTRRAVTQWRTRSVALAGCGHARLRQHQARGGQAKNSGSRRLGARESLGRGDRAGRNRPEGSAIPARLQAGRDRPVTSGWLDAKHQSAATSKPSEPYRWVILQSEVGRSHNRRVQRARAVGGRKRTLRARRWNASEEILQATGWGSD